MQYNPHYDGPETTAPKVRFSRIEVQHLLIAVGLLTVAFAFVLGDGDTFDMAARLQALIDNPAIIVGSLLAVSSGFVLHELAHKIVAQRYGHWAEFRAQMSGLLGSVAVAVFLKFLFALPGAVMISGRVTQKENGIISIVGPMTNLVIALVAFPFGLAVNPDAFVPQVARTVTFVNAMLAVFNLLPFGPLDGRKVLRWNKLWYLLALAASVSMLVMAFALTPPF